MIVDDLLSQADKILVADVQTLLDSLEETKP